MPKTCATLTEYIDSLPYGDSPIADPFTSLVINFNVSTVIHRDRDDQDICLVLVASDCTGGELCMLEPGLVLDLRPGDFVIFPSMDISHFNLHFNSCRSSLVFTSDRHGRKWAHTNNNWRHNLFVRSTLQLVK